LVPGISFRALPNRSQVIDDVPFRHYHYLKSPLMVFWLAILTVWLKAGRGQDDFNVCAHGGLMPSPVIARLCAPLTILALSTSYGSFNPTFFIKWIIRTAAGALRRFDSGFYDVAPLLVVARDLPFS
jgi:hypothetical protein